MHSREIEEQIKTLEGKRRGAVAESIRHTVEATDALTRATLLVAYSQLRTAEAVEELGKKLSTIRFKAFIQGGGGQGVIDGELIVPESNVLQHGPQEIKDLSQERVSIPK